MLTSIDLLIGEETERAPVWVMRQAGRYLPGKSRSNPTLVPTPLSPTNIRTTLHHHRIPRRQERSQLFRMLQDPRDRLRIDHATHPSIQRSPRRRHHLLRYPRRPRSHGFDRRDEPSAFPSQPYSNPGRSRSVAQARRCEQGTRVRFRGGQFDQEDVARGSPFDRVLWGALDVDGVHGGRRWE